MSELLTSKKSIRNSLFPLHYEDIYEYSRKSQRNYWTVDEVKFNDDVTHIKSATKGEYNLLKYIIGFFLTADNRIIDIINDVSLPMFTVPEAISFEHQKMANEDIHVGTYSNAGFSLFSDIHDEFCSALQDDEAIKLKLGWINKWLTKDVSLGTYLIAMSLFEGISFQGLFCAISKVCETGKYPGLRFSNELIARDEQLHSDYYTFLYKKYTDEIVPTRTIHKMIRDLVRVEEKFIDSALEHGVDGMNKSAMLEYVKYVSDNYCERLGILPVYNATNTVTSTNKLNYKIKTNFFEDKDTGYMKFEAENGDDWIMLAPKYI